MKNGLTKRTLKIRENLECNGAVVFQWVLFKVQRAQVELAKNEDSFRFRPERRSDADSWAGHAMTLPYFSGMNNCV